MQVQQKKKPDLTSKNMFQKYLFIFWGQKKVFPAPCSLLTFPVAPAYDGCRMNPHHSWEQLDNKCEAVKDRWIK